MIVQYGPVAVIALVFLSSHLIWLSVKDILEQGGCVLEIMVDGEVQHTGNEEEIKQSSGVCGDGAVPRVLRW